MSTMRWPLALLCALGALVLNVPSAVAREFTLLNFNEKGALQNKDDLVKELRQRKDTPPTHIILMAHGWNNRESEAREEYTRILKEMDRAADKSGLALKPATYRPLLIGLHWPSLAFENNEELIGHLLREIPPPTKTIVKVALERKYDIDAVVDILDGKASSQTLKRIVKLAQVLLGQGSLVPKGEDAPNLKELDAKDVGTLTDAIRILSFWEMKQRGETIGKTGARAVLLNLQKEWPKAEVHLIGHSFGCKLWLAALLGETVRPVHSLVLIQGAVSHQAFAQQVVVKNGVVKGGYHDVGKTRVNGPIVATFTERDWPVKHTYPLGARAAGHVAEAVKGLRKEEGSLYRGMGAHGIEGGQVVEPRAAGTPLGLQKGQLYNFGKKGSKAIGGHSSFYTEEVAWLIWAAVLGK